MRFDSFALVLMDSYGFHLLYLLKQSQCSNCLKPEALSNGLLVTNHLPNLYDYRRIAFRCSARLHCHVAIYLTL